MNTVAKAFGCQLMWECSASWMTDVYGKYVFIGLKSQTELAQYTAEVMQRKLLKAKTEFSKTLMKYTPRAYKSTQLNGFCLGWVNEVSKTVHAFALDEETKQMITDHVEEKTIGKAKNRVQRYSTAGYQAGLEAGSGESIHRPMGAQQNLMIGA